LNLSRGSRPTVNMDTALKKLPPSLAWEEVERRSIIFGVAGFVFVGALQAAGAIPAIYRQSFQLEGRVSFRLSGILPHSPDTVLGLLSQPLEPRSSWDCSLLDSALLGQPAAGSIHGALPYVPCGKPCSARSNQPVVRTPADFRATATFPAKDGGKEKISQRRRGQRRICRTGVSLDGAPAW